MRLSGAQVTRIKEQLHPLLRKMGLRVDTTHPNWSRAHSYGQEHRAIEEFISSTLEILDLQNNVMLREPSKVVEKEQVSTEIPLECNSILERVDSAEEVSGSRA